MADSSIGDTAAEDTTKPVPGVPPTAAGIQPERFWQCWKYYGTRRDLDCTGLVPAGLLFPGELPPRQRCRFVMPGGRKAGIVKAAHKGRGWFCLSVYWSAADSAADEAMAKTAAAVQAEEKAAIAEAGRQAADLFWKGFQVFVNAHLFEHTGMNGYRFSREDEYKFAGAAAKLYSEIRDAKLVHGGAERTHKVAGVVREASSNAAKANIPRHPFLRLVGASMPSDDATQ